MDITKNIDQNKKGKIEVNTSNLYNIDSLIKTDTKIGWVNTILILLMFIIIFFILIPTLLYKNKYYTFLEAYLPNIDLIANLLTFHGGPFRGSWLLKNMFSNLYQITPISTRAFFSQSVINYLALLGVTYIIARESVISKSLVKGWSLGFVMLFMTYLLPSQFISSFMSYIHLKIEYILNHKKNYKKDSPYYITLILGIILTICVILTEKLVIKGFRKYLIKGGNYILKIPTLIK